MAGASIETRDLAEFYNSEFGVSALVLGDTEPGIFSREEIDNEEMAGTFDTFRCARRIDEGTSITITEEDGSENDYRVEAVMDLDFGEYLHLLQDAPTE